MVVAIIINKILMEKISNKKKNNEVLNLSYYVNIIYLI